MGFISGVITGVAVAAGAAAWYMSRSGEKFRDQYRVERRLGEIGDQLEARTREIQSSVNAQLADLKAKTNELESGSSNGHTAAETLDAAQAGAAEVAAEAAAAAETTVTKVKKAAKDAGEEITEG